MAEIRRATGVVFPVTVDHTQSLRKMIGRVQFRVLDPRVTEEHFPVSPILGEVRSRIGFFRPQGRRMSGELYRATRMAGKASTLPEVLALIMEHRERLDSQYPLAVFGSIWETGTELLIPVVTEEAGGLALELKSLQAAWDERYTIPITLN